jgi:hypothetical protein
MKYKMPSFHQQRVSPRKLQNLKTKLQNIKNAIIINDEIDTGIKKTRNYIDYWRKAVF